MEKFKILNHSGGCCGVLDLHVDGVPQKLVKKILQCMAERCESYDAVPELAPLRRNKKDNNYSLLRYFAPLDNPREEFQQAARFMVSDRRKAKSIVKHGRALGLHCVGIKRCGGASVFVTRPNKATEREGLRWLRKFDRAGGGIRGSFANTPPKNYNPPEIDPKISTSSGWSKSLYEPSHVLLARLNQCRDKKLQFILNYRQVGNASHNALSVINATGFVPSVFWFNRNSLNPCALFLHPSMILEL